MSMTHRALARKTPICTALSTGLFGMVLSMVLFIGSTHANDGTNSDALTILHNVTIKQATKQVTPMQQKTQHKTLGTDAPKPYKSTAQVLADAPSEHWYTIAQDNLLYMRLDDDRLVVIELAPRFAPEHVAQIRLLAHHRHWDGLHIQRLQDNYVAQLGSFDIKTETKTKALPSDAKAKLPAEFSVKVVDVPIVRLPDSEPYSDGVGFVDGLPVALRGEDVFVVHCYGIVGAGRMEAGDSSQADELYVMIGQPARHLDNQITVVGRVVHGIEHLSTLPRGKGAMGFYGKDESPVPIVSMRMGSELPKDERLTIKVLDVQSPSFETYVNARRHAQGDWFVAPMHGGMGVCDVRPPVRIEPKS